MFSQRKEINGFGLVEVMIAMAILSIITVGMTRFLQSTNRNVSNVQLFTQLDRMLDQLYRTASERAVLVASAQHPLNKNTGLKDCVVGGQCRNQGPLPFFLLGGGSNGLFLSGTPMQPVYYFPDGRVCLAKPEECPLMVTTFFEPFCQIDDVTKPPRNRVPTCPRAAVIKIAFAISQTYLPHLKRHVPIPRFSTGKPGEMILKPREGETLVYPPQEQTPPSMSTMVRVKREISNAMAVNRIFVVFNGQEAQGIHVGPNIPTPKGGPVLDRGEQKEVTTSLKMGCCNQVILKASTEPPPNDQSLSNIRKQVSSEYLRDAQHFKIIDHRLESGGSRHLVIGYEDHLDKDYQDMVFSMTLPGQAEIEFINGIGFAKNPGVSMPQCTFQKNPCQ